MNDLIPNRSTSPYYVIAPPYTRKSAGIQSLHLLCHWLNRSGYPAFIHILGTETAQKFHPDLITPELTQLVLHDHLVQNRTPIAIYPETVKGNPLQATCVVRYLLNYPGLLGGDKTYGTEELIFGYTEKLARSVDNASGVLFMPMVNRSIFYATGETVREGACFYAAKYRRAGYQVFGLPDDAVEIYRDEAHAQSQADIAELFRRCRKFYTFEDTALSLEAALCGCPTVAMRSSFFSVPLMSSEFGAAGLALDDSVDEFARAVESVSDVAVRYDEHVSAFWHQLENFIRITQEKAFTGPKTDKAYKLPVYTQGWRQRLWLRIRRQIPRVLRRAVGKMVHTT